MQHRSFNKHGLKKNTTTHYYGPTLSMFSKGNATTPNFLMTPASHRNTTGLSVFVQWLPV